MKMQKVISGSKTRALDYIYSGAIYGEVPHKMAVEIAKEIDQNILSNIKGLKCEEEGWIMLPMYSYIQKRNLTFREIKQWLEENTIDDYHYSVERIWFKDSQDATMFALQWS